MSLDTGKVEDHDIRVTRPTYDQTFWEQLWSKTLREHGDKLALRAPNAHLVSAAEGLSAGRALDAGCGHGAETLWLAGHGWQVSALDFSESALAHGRATAEALGPELAARIEWTHGDLATWVAPTQHFDLVVSLYVHVAGSVEDMVRRMASAVADGGTLLLVGHRPVDPATGAATPAANQQQVSVESAISVLDRETWQSLIAEERRRSVANTGVDAVILARRMPRQRGL